MLTTFNDYANGKLLGSEFRKKISEHLKEFVRQVWEETHHNPVRLEEEVFKAGWVLRDAFNAVFEKHPERIQPPLSLPQIKSQFLEFVFSETTAFEFLRGVALGTRSALSNNEIVPLSVALFSAFALGLASAYYQRGEHDAALITLTRALNSLAAIRAARANQEKTDPSYLASVYDTIETAAITLLEQGTAMDTIVRNQMTSEWGDFPNTLSHTLRSGYLAAQFPRFYAALMAHAPYYEKLVATGALDRDNLDYYRLVGKLNDALSLARAAQQVIYKNAERFNKVSREEIIRKELDNTLTAIGRGLLGVVNAMPAQHQQEFLVYLYNKVVGLGEHRLNVTPEAWLVMFALAREGVKENREGMQALGKLLLWQAGLTFNDANHPMFLTFSKLIGQSAKELLTLLGFSSWDEWVNSVPRYGIPQQVRIGETKATYQPPPDAETIDPQELYQRLATVTGHSTPPKPEKLKHMVVVNLTKKLLSDSRVRALMGAIGVFPSNAPKQVIARWVYSIVDGFVGTWAMTALDTHPLAYLIQERAAEVFRSPTASKNVLKLLAQKRFSQAIGKGSGSTPVWEFTGTPSFNPSSKEEALRDALCYLRAATPFIDAYLVTVYLNTQELLNSANIPSNAILYPLYRGMEGVNHLPQKTALAHNPLSSFSTNRAEADKFGRSYKTGFPAWALWSTPFTGPGCYNEKELIGINVLGEVWFLTEGRSGFQQLIVDLSSA